MAGAQLRKEPYIVHHEWMEGRGAPLKQNPSTRKRRTDEAGLGRKGRTHQGEGQNQGGGSGVHNVFRTGGTGPDANERVVGGRRENARPERRHRLQSREI